MTQQTGTSVSGTIRIVKDENRISEKFSKREIVIDTGGDYPQILAVEFVNDKIDLIAACKPGDSVQVEVNIRGREWTSPQGEVRHFVSLQGWRINREKGNAPPPYEPPPTPPPEDDIPF